MKKKKKGKKIHRPEKVIKERSPPELSRVCTRRAVGAKVKNCTQWEKKK